MPLPMVEQISVELEARIRDISVANGYNFDYVNLGEDEIRVADAIFEINDFPRLYVPADDEARAGAFTAGSVETSKSEREVRLLVIGFVRCENSDTALNKVRQDIERAVFQSGDAVPLGLPGVTALVPVTVSKWQSPKLGDKRAAVGVTFVATYRYTRGNP